VFVALSNAFVFNTEIMVDMAAHEMHGWQSEGLVTMAAGVGIKVLCASLHFLDILNHGINLRR